MFHSEFRMLVPKNSEAYVIEDSIVNNKW
jgi:hypothetical protein